MLTQKALQDESSQWETEQTEQSEEERGTKGGGRGSRSERGGRGGRGQEKALADVARERRQHGVQGLQTGGRGGHALRYAGGSEGKVEGRKPVLMEKVSLFAPAVSGRGSGDAPARGGGEGVRHKLKSLRGHPSAVNPQVESMYIHMYTYMHAYMHTCIQVCISLRGLSLRR